MTVSLLYSTETGFLASPRLLSQNTQYIMEREQTPDDAQVAMISGPLSPSPTFFATHYEARIINALNSGHYFVIGPSFGIDRQALCFILERLSFGSYPDNETSSRVAVFFFQGEEKFRKNAEFIEYLEQNHVEIVVAGRNHTERDAAMTAVSDYDILHYLSESECKVLYGNKYKSRNSGTEMNELRRLEMEKQEGKAKQIVTSLEVSPDRTF